MRQHFTERIELLTEVYLPIHRFEKEIKPFAIKKDVDDVKKKFDLCAK